MDLSSQSIVLTEDIVSRANKDGTFVIMKMDDSDTFFKINGVATEIWKGLSEGNQLKDVVADIQENFDVSEEQLEKDVEVFLTTLKTNGLIK
jgi:DNA-directed RNA polymerase delta subunit